MKNPITYLKEKQEEKKRLEQRQADRKRKRAEKELDEKYKTTEKRLTTSLKTAETNFEKAMDAEDHVSARQHANELKSCEINIKKNDALKRQADRTRRLVESNIVSAETLGNLKEMTDLMKVMAGDHISATELDKMRDALERNIEDIETYARESEEIIAELASIPTEEEVSDEELKAMKERYKASKAAKEGGVRAVEGADKEIADMLSSLGGPSGNA